MPVLFPLGQNTSKTLPVKALRHQVRLVAVQSIIRTALQGPCRLASRSKAISGKGSTLHAMRPEHSQTAQIGPILGIWVF
jgi:hypothetical protein